MEKELRGRLLKIRAHPVGFLTHEETLIENTVATLEAIRAHILEAHLNRQGEIVIADTAIELVKGYR